MVLFCESVDEILKGDQSSQSFQTVLSIVIVYYVVQGGSKFCVCESKPRMYDHGNGNGIYILHSFTYSNAVYITSVQG